jgi:hypothetical protein
MGRALYHLSVGDALRHHFCCPDSGIELLGPALGLEPGKVLVVRLRQPGVVLADVPGGVFPVPLVGRTHIFLLAVKVYENR